MQIQHIHIERFGGWRQLDLPLQPRGLTVLYGPNETGKSTLLRFIRGVLYGFQPADETDLGRRPRRVGAAGRLDFSAQNADYSLRRESSFGTRGHPQLAFREGAALPPASLEQLLGGVSEDVFERVFALGLDELQQLASLHGERIAGQIYDMSLGLEGERVVSACRAGDAARRRLLDVDEQTGEIADWLAAVEAVDREIAAQGDPLQKFAALQADAERVAAEVADQKQRQRGMQEQLRGHQFLDRVWGRWRRVRRLEADRDDLGPDVEFPPDGVDRLNAIDAGLRASRRRRSELRDQIRDGRERLGDLVAERTLADKAPAMHALLDRAEAMRRLETELAPRRAALETSRQTLLDLRRKLGADWTDERLKTLDSSPGAAVRLLKQAAVYRRALSGRKRAIARYQRLSAAVQQEQLEHTARLRDFGGRDFDEVYEELSSVTADLHEFARARSRLADGQTATEALRRQLAACERPRALPPYYYAILGLFGVGGAVMAVLGLMGVLHTLAGGPAPWTVGGIFMLLGTCCAGATWTMKRQFDPAGDAAAELRARAEDADAAQARERARMLDLWDHAAGVLGFADAPSPPSTPEQIEKCLLAAQQRLDTLADLERCDESLKERRRRLSVLRGRIRELQRRASHARRGWCDILKQLGLDESVRINASLEIWQHAASAGRLLRESALEHARLDQDVHAAREFEDQVRALARELADCRLSLRESTPSDRNTATQATQTTRLPPLETLLADWRRRLDSIAAAAAERRTLRSTLRNYRREFRRLTVRIASLTCQRVRLLAGVGACSRREFLEREQACRRRQELDAQLHDARQELAEAASTEPQLAVVEEDLERFDPEENRQAVDTLQAELADLEGDLQRAHESLGRLRQEMASLEADRSLTRLRYDRAQAVAELEQAVRQLCSVELACRALDQARARIEAACQPETLIAAGRYLRRLTLGRYPRVWTPAGERRLVVDDDQGRVLGVEQLSHGAREQLFLAIRLALIDRFRQRGVELPVILDDVVVNFDQFRTEAAVETLVEYAASGPQVILLTCHLHLARLFESAGALPVRLPEGGEGEARRKVG